MARQAAQPLRRQAGLRGRPVGVLRHAVDLAPQVGRDGPEADGIAGQEVRVVQAFRQQGVREPHHDRRVRAGAGREPFRLQRLGGVAAERADVDELDARLGAGRDLPAQPVPPDAAAGDLGVAQRDAAEHHDQPAFAGDHAPPGRLLHVVAEAAHDVGHQHQGRVVAVVALGAYEAAGRVEEALELALGVVEAPGARPAVGAGEDRFVAVGLPDAGQFPGDQAQRFVPAHLDEGLGAPFAGACQRAVLQIAAPHRGAAHAGAAGEAVRDVLVDPRGAGVIRMRPDRDQPPLRQLRQAHAPVAGGQVEVLVGGGVRHRDLCCYTK